MFTLDEGAGVLFKVLALFALREINLTKVHAVIDEFNIFSKRIVTFCL